MDTLPGDGGVNNNNWFDVHKIKVKESAYYFPPLSAFRVDAKLIFRLVLSGSEWLQYIRI